MVMSMIDPRTLTNDALIAAVERLARVSRETTAELIAHLVVMEERNLHLACGFSSLFLYCRRVLHFSESEAYDRMQAARAARRFPVILAMLSAGSLHLTAVRLLAPHLKSEDHLALLGGALHKSAEKVRELLARWFPQPDVAASVRRLPGSRRRRDGRKGLNEADGTAAAPAADCHGASKAGPPDTPASASAPLATLASHEAEHPKPVPAGAEPRTQADSQTLDRGSQPSGQEPQPSAPVPVCAARPPAPVQRPAVAPLAPGRHLFKFTGDDETVALLREAQELLSHRLPDGDVAAIVKEGLRMVVAKARRDRYAATRSDSPVPAAATQHASPRSQDSRPEDPASRTIRAGVQRLVWDRDRGQCSFIGRDGCRCEERRFLEYHHLRPWSVGGPPSVENIALRCRAHNQYEAKVYFAPIREALSYGMGQDRGRGTIPEA